MNKLNSSQIKRLINNHQYALYSDDHKLLKRYEKKILENFPDLNEFYIKHGDLIVN